VDTVAASVRLRELGEELLEIGAFVGQQSEPPTGALTAGGVRATLRARRCRDSLFPPGLFADPAWDILLELLASHLEGGRVSVSELCTLAAVPQTTALRWMTHLTKIGLIARIPDRRDGRRVLLELTDSTIEILVKCLGDGAALPLPNRRDGNAKEP
jgi:DNA-binding transcriptional ArsR family regulator